MGAKFSNNIPENTVASIICIDNNGGYTLELSGCGYSNKDILAGGEHCINLRDECGFPNEGNVVRPKIRLQHSGDIYIKPFIVFSDFGPKVTIRTDRSIWDARGFIEKIEPRDLSTHDSCLNGKCYVPRYTSTNFGEAENLCQIIGGNLASIGSQAENEKVRQVLAHSSLNNEGAVWIGLMRVDDSTSEYEEWTDGTPYIYENWGPGEPNQVQTACEYHRCGQDYENAAVIRRDGTWVDLWADLHVRHFVCEIYADLVEDEFPFN